VVVVVVVGVVRLTHSPQTRITRFAVVVVVVVVGVVRLTHSPQTRITRFAAACYLCRTIAACC
jgi:hypothetical protein